MHDLANKMKSLQYSESFSKLDGGLFLSDQLTKGIEVL